MSFNSQVPLAGRTVLHFWQAEYWRTAVNELSSLRTLCLAALMAGLIVAVEAFLYIPVGENLRIMFSFLFFALGGAIYGPVVSVLVGFVSDILGASIFPTGAFFFGYTLTAMVTTLLFGLFLYRQRISILRLSLCRLSVNLLANVLMNSLWSSILVGKGYLYFLVKNLSKNLILLPIEIVMLTFLFTALQRLLRQRGVFVRPKNKYIDIW